jgi:hypothetical protein
MAAAALKKSIADILLRYFEDMDTNAADVKPLINELAELTSSQLKQAKDAAPKTKAKPKAKSKSDSDGAKKTGNSYSKFVGLVAAVKKNPQQFQQLLNLNVLISYNNFKDHNSKSAIKIKDLIDSHALQLPDSCSFDDLLNLINPNLDATFSNSMTHTGAVWGLLDPDHRLNLLKLYDGDQPDEDD